MYKIGDFSILAKTTVKTLRYYEKEKILIPSFVDEETGYRYYKTTQLIELARIIALRQIGLSINEIKEVLCGKNITKFLLKRKQNIEKEVKEYNYQLSKINYLLEENCMNYEVITKELPSYTIYYKEGYIKDFSELPNFIINSAIECQKINPDIKCISPDYCYVNYLDKEFQDKNLFIRYAQAVEKIGISNDIIKFETLNAVEAICIYHKGSYDSLPNAYSFIMKYIEDNNYEIIESIRERYIDGIWNQKDESEWLTEIQVPVRKQK